MKRSSKHLLGVAVLAFSLVSAVASADEKLYGNISQGHVGISGTVTLDTTWAQGQSSVTVFSVANRTHYFVADRLGIGGALTLSTQTGLTTMRLGPSLQYYFWTSDRVGAYFTQDVAWRLFSTSNTNASTAATFTALGVNYFITRSVALGPALQFNHTFGTSVYATVNDFAFAGQFAIYL